jgi:hypothetical protein
MRIRWHSESPLGDKTMKLFQTEVTICATLYILAKSEAEANAKADALTDGNTGIEFSSRRQEIGEGLFVTGETYNPDMPEMSLSPSMTIKESATRAAVWESEDFGEDDDNQCGQCEGTGTTQSASNLEDEECPVCDGTWEL